MGKSPSQERIADSLEECYQANKHKKGMPFRVAFQGKTYYVWSTSHSNVSAAFIHGLGFTVESITLQELLTEGILKEVKPK